MKPYTPPGIAISTKLLFPMTPDRHEWLFDGWERPSSMILHDYCGVPFDVVTEHCAPPANWGEIVFAIAESLGVEIG